MISVISRTPHGTQNVMRNCTSVSHAISTLASCRVYHNQLTPKDTATKFAIVNAKTVRYVGDIIHPIEYDMIYGEH